ncbi:aconitate hydratase AcnA [Erysipelothrix aquatica]|uniref:aconitate hydratase AcnA n=1 Tax=Erysipelothrix aquatica TaxID=2683714 RepID=UPI0013579AB7|nr:aconitate hydratase AcnA [Erysipelothrix aquatica]
MKNECFESRINTNDKRYFDIKKFAKNNGANIHSLPYTIRILLENTIRQEANDGVYPKSKKLLDWVSNRESQIDFFPTRILLQDYTGVPCIVDLASMRDAAVLLGFDAALINPKIPVDLVIDHSVQIDRYASPKAMYYNIKKEFERNSERYRLIKWAQKSFDNFRVIPPDSGIIHQINIEYLCEMIKMDDEGYIYPDSVFGTDSHTTMINGMGVLGWGVGGIEAEACMLGEPSVFSIPDVIGVRLINTLPEGVVATDLALTITGILRSKNVVGKFVEFFGEGFQNLSLSDRVTISNMSPEYGSTCGYFPFDKETLKYLQLTGRTTESVALIEEYMKSNNLFYDETRANQIKFSEVIEIDLSVVSTSLSGPKRPQDIVRFDDLSKDFVKSLTNPVGHKGFGLNNSDSKKSVCIDIDDEKMTLEHGDILLAAITSCTNTSNPRVLIGAGLFAKNAVEKGLKVSKKVKTSFAPGSKAVTKYLSDSGLIESFNELGFNIVAYGCTTCIGNSGPLDPRIEQAIALNDIVAAAILSGNRNFEGRIHPLIKANYLASPLLVIAYAIAGNLKIDLTDTPIGQDTFGNPVYFNELCPTTEEVEKYVNTFVNDTVFRSAYQNVFEDTPEWRTIEVEKSETYDWQNESTYIANPPYFEKQINQETEINNLKDMRVLVKVGDSITTDHISPAGKIYPNSPAGMFLSEHQVREELYNTYGSRRGHHEVMTRGTFANVRLKNQLLDDVLGGYTYYFPNHEVLSVYEASQRYKMSNTGLLVVAGKDYGMGSSRDWAAKGVRLLGVKVVIAESFERIHRSNLVMMGVIPLQFLPEESFDGLGLKGDEIYSVEMDEHVKPGDLISVKVTTPNQAERKFKTVLRLDSYVELNIYKHGGILNKIIAELD